MKRIFNTAGPCNPAKHYVLPTLMRCPEIGRLIENEQYFVIHAARQTGKTTILNALEFELNSHNEYVALYCSLETVQGITDPKEGIPAIIRAIRSNLRWHPVFKKAELPAVDMSDYNTGLKTFISDLSVVAQRPFVLLLDEADCLSDQTLITFLRQLRDGYINRVRTPFPASVALVGMRNIRDYKATIRNDAQTLGSASPFNVITKALTLTNFTHQEIASLYKQHTVETSQIFEAAAIDHANYLTCGQPWLVNALAYECIESILNRDYTQLITADLIDKAAQNIIRRRDTHIDSLLEKLKEARVRNVVEPVILGKELSVDYTSDDRMYCLDLGLLKEEKGSLVPANPIYAEIILRTLAFGAQMEMQMMVPDVPWLYADRIDMNSLLKAFQQFWRENSEAYTRAVITYPEAAPHLMLQAFLQRVINTSTGSVQRGGGNIIREFALGSMRLDLLVVYQSNKYPIEIKLEYQMKKKTIEQLIAYMDRTGTVEGWLVVFDRSTEKTWDEKIRWETKEIDHKTVHVVWC